MGVRTSANLDRRPGVLVWTLSAYRCLSKGTRKELSMGFRRRTRRRALIAGAAVAHHHDRKMQEQYEQGYDDAPAYQEPAYQEQAAPVPPPEDPADQIEHLAQLHASGALTDEEFAAAKAKALGM